MTNSLEVPALIPAAGGAVLALGSGAVHYVHTEQARALFRSGGVVVAHAVFVAGRLKVAPCRSVFDLLELFAFVRPGQPCIPSPLGLARALMLPPPASTEECAQTLLRAAHVLLGELAHLSGAERERLRPLASTLAKTGWRWGPSVLREIGEPERAHSPIAGLDVWKTLPEWEDEAPPPKVGSQAVSPQESRARLHRLVGQREIRPEQSAYAEEATHAFGPRERVGSPKIALVEAGTGVGKTLGYLAPASLWAEKNGPGLWISTYTRNLQRQIVQEMAHLFPDPAEREDKAVVRKGRENYLCLLNFEEAAKRQALAPGQRTVALGLIARWIAGTRDGDMSGAGFPAFLTSSFPMSEITDRRGECVYAACPHYRRCFVERVVRRARHAPIVIANHALVIAQASQDWLASAGDDDATQPERRVRYVFDEGHHLFDAADSGFSAFLSGREMADLRRWIRGPEARARTRMRGLDQRLKDVIAGDEIAQSALQECLDASAALAGEGWMARLHGGAPRGPGEAFLARAHSQVLARSEQLDKAYSLEAETHPLSGEMTEAARRLSLALHRLIAPLLQLAHCLRKQLDDKAAELESSERTRLEAAARGLERRAKLVLPAWAGMLDMLETGERQDAFVEWFEIVREDTRDLDVGLRRHWIDPTIPLSQEILTPAHGALITSATLRDAPNGADDWQSAEVRTGAAHLPEPPRRASFGSPFRYAEQARVFIVRDVNRRDMEQVAAAFRELFLASGGGGLGLFTAVRALRAVEQRISTPLAEAGINLYAQHVDRMDTGALVDLFRAEENACLLGTDALRDGVDVPGRSLRLVVFDKVPWSKPTILHKARRTHFGKTYDDLLTRLRLKQAFGRLIRSQTDKGCFVILEPATPSRLLSAFPPPVAIRRCGLAEAVREIRQFLGPQEVGYANAHTSLTPFQAPGEQERANQQDECEPGR